MGSDRREGGWRCGIVGTDSGHSCAPGKLGGDEPGLKELSVKSPFHVYITDVLINYG